MSPDAVTSAATLAEVHVVEPGSTSVLRFGDVDGRARGTGGSVLVDLATPCVARWPEDGVPAFRVGVDELAVPRGTARAASRTIRTDPLYPLVRDHLLVVAARAPTLAPAAAAALGAASVQLVRALVLSAAGDARSPADPTPTPAPVAVRVQAYVRVHLRDPALCPEQIAAANAVSTRTLYAIYAALGTSLEQSIIDQRLKGARVDLMAPGRRHQSIAAVARSWGFRHPSFFAQRFRRAFGVTPGECRAGAVLGSTLDPA
ncbi:helix-turn-helix transcriptional regulator [Actinomycetospora sp. CA-101289]|uniref:helix-turn-helix transcriptional regulator n=1 Tax=Actinomycetospora sp. CA-101289 TaxID=3239893 RepID=UPI003D97AEB3